MVGLRKGAWVSLALLGVLILATNACGGGGSSGSSATTTTTPTVSTKTEGIDVPENIETVPDKSATGKSYKSGFASGLLNTSHTDYDKDQLHMRVALKALERFDVVDEVLEAISDTGYDDARVINKGPYAAMISFEEENGKEMEKWVVDSKMLVENGKDVNKISAWIDEGDVIIKALFKIYEAPTATNEYGVWRIDAGFYNKATGALSGTFVASSENTADGGTFLQVNLQEDEGGGTFIVKSKLYLKDAVGRGIIQFNEPWQQVQPSDHTALYAYDATHVIIQADGGLPKVFDRTSYNDIYMDYNVYTADGTNIKKNKQFGIPLKYTDANNKEYFLYYGGWMGRHQIWTPFDLTLPEGTTLYGNGFDNQNVQYTLAKRYMGYLVEKTLIDAVLDEIKGETLQAWINNGYEVVYAGGVWKGWNPQTQTADNVTHPTTEFINDPTNHKNVFLFRYYPFPGNPVSVDMSGNFVGYTPQDGDRIHVNVSEPVFISYTGTGWVRYMTVTFEGWEPTVSNPQAYTFTQDDRLYLNSKGINFILTISGTGGTQTFTLQKELENVIQPGAEALARDGWQFTTFDNETYTFDWDPATLGITLTNAGTGAQQTTPIWYMTRAGDTAHSYSWQYAQNANETWNIMVYLKDANGNFIFLDDPIFFAPVTIGGKTINSLGYDGHLFGIPNVWEMIRGKEGDADWDITADKLAKIVNIPAGTVLTEKGGTTTYLIKPVFGMQFLTIVTSGFTVQIDSTLTLADLITYTDPQIGDAPTVDVITVQEGVFVTP